MIKLKKVSVKYDKEIGLRISNEIEIHLTWKERIALLFANKMNLKIEYN